MIDVRRLQHVAWDFVRAIVGLILLVAASLKFYQLLSPQQAGYFSDQLSAITIAVESTLAVLLLCGIVPVATRFGAIGFFCTAGCVALFKALKYEESCGCFGSWALGPWWAFSIDVVTVVGLSLARPFSSRVSTGKSAARAAVVGLSAACVAVSLLAVPLVQSGSREALVLEPSLWPGNEFELLGHIGTAETKRTLQHGKWLVFIYDPKCSICRDILPSYRALAVDFAASSNAPSVALLNISPIDDYRGFARPRYLECELTGTRAMLARGPCTIYLEDGIVRTVFDSPQDIELLRTLWPNQPTSALLRQNVNHLF